MAKRESGYSFVSQLVGGAGLVSFCSDVVALNIEPPGFLYRGRCLHEYGAQGLQLASVLRVRPPHPSLFCLAVPPLCGVPLRRAMGAGCRSYGIVGLLFQDEACSRLLSGIVLGFALVRSDVSISYFRRGLGGQRRNSRDH